MFEPAIVLAEVAGAVSRARDTELADEAIAYLRHNPTVDLLAIDESLAVRSAKVAAELRVRGGDAVYIALAEQLQVPLVSWDDEHHSRGGKRVPVYRPSDLLAEMR